MSKETEKPVSINSLMPNLGVTGDGVWQLNGRAAPAPAAASDQLRSGIAASPQPDATGESLVPASHEEWKTLIATLDSQRAPETLAMAQKLHLSIQSDRIEGVGIHHVLPDKIRQENMNRLFINVHGGAYILGKGEAGLGEAVLIATRLGIPVLSIDYRMPPDDPFPAAINDVERVYRHLVQKHDPASIILGGSSAGAGLAMASIHQFRSLNLPLPGALYAGTIWADLTKTSDSLFTNEGLDMVLVKYDGILEEAAKLYAGGRDLKDPKLSPVYGDLRGFPPTLLVTGTRDLFLSDACRTHRSLRAAGVTADLHVYEGMSHAGYYFFPEAPESKDLYRELAAFVDQHVA
jgi:acetyl esterase/lipase